MSITPSKDRWLVGLSTPRSPTVRLILFPFAGAGPQAFAGWSSSFPDTVEVLAVQLPGRGARFTEPACRSVTGIVESLLPALASRLGERTVFFGHSTGALLAFETARRLHEVGYEPSQLHLSGNPPPGVHRRRAIHDLPDDRFVEEIRRLSGTPPEVLESKELLSLVLPTLRADFEAMETYASPLSPPLRCPIFVYGGASDPWASRADLQAWKQATSRRFAVRIFPGNHFYFSRSIEPLTGEIRRHLEEGQAA